MIRIRTTVLVLCLAMCLMMTSCSKGADKPDGSGDYIVLQNPDITYEAPLAYQTAMQAAEEVPVFRNGTDGIDIDITVLSSTMVYSVVYCMVTAPDDYIGMVVKMNGQFTYYCDEQSGNEYYACIIQDATACCSQGIEFVLADSEDYNYPDDYPVPGEEITVTGTFDTYEENGYTYCVLREAELCAG